MTTQATNDCPDHMDKWARNERLFQQLVDSGLYVERVYHPNDRTAIDHLIVSAGLPGQEQYQG